MRFVDRRQVRATQRCLQYVDSEHFKTTLACGKPAHYLVLQFASKIEARAARDRIIEEHKGGDWPPFFAAFAAPSIVRFMEQPVQTRTPGAAM